MAGTPARFWAARRSSTRRPVSELGGLLSCCFRVFCTLVARACSSRERVVSTAGWGAQRLAEPRAAVWSVVVLLPGGSSSSTRARHGSVRPALPRTAEEAKAALDGATANLARAEQARRGLLRDHIALATAEQGFGSGSEDVRTHASLTAAASVLQSCACACVGWHRPTASWQGVGPPASAPANQR